MSDYGYINGAYNTPIPDRQEIKRTQVYEATHKGEGANARLPFMNRSFISFSFGSKKDSEGNEIPVYIEDFNLVATINGDRLERQGYAEFEDLISEYEVLDGHFYWGTHYTNHELEFELATDGMTQKELDSFLHWFQPGKTRELILSEHPNRVIQARVSVTPSLHLLPFEQKTTKMIAGEGYSTSTTLYKGEITLTLIMEEPYWYSKINIFGKLDKNTGVYRDIWVDANNREVDLFKSPDAIKIALEDNIPIASMIGSSMLLGNNTYANANITEGAKTAGHDYPMDEIDNNETKKIKVSLSDDVWSCFVYEPTTFVKAFPQLIITNEVAGQDDIQLIDEQEDFTCYIDINSNHTFSIKYGYDGNEPTTTTQGNWQFTDSENPDEIMLDPTSGDIFTYLVNPGMEEYITEQSRIAQIIGGIQEIFVYGARIAGTVMSESTGIEEFAADENQYFYYAGNAPSQPTIQFTLTPTFDSYYYVSNPRNSYSEDTKGRPYNTITFESMNKKTFEFTTPGVYTGYNQAMKIFNEHNGTGEAYADIRKLIRDYVNHPAARAWANKVIDMLIAEAEANPSEDPNIDTTVVMLNTNAPIYMSYFLKDENGYGLDSTFEFNSKTGRAIGKIKYRTVNEYAVADWTTYGLSIDNEVDISRKYDDMIHEEDVGDMVRSNYLIIEDQNQPTEDGHIVAWVGNTDENKLHSHIVRHDVENGLKNVFIKYQNMYL